MLKLPKKANRKGDIEFMDRHEKAAKWELCHKIINTIRMAKGIELSNAKNPHKGIKKEDGKHEV